MSSNVFYSKGVDRTKPWCVYVVVCSVEGLPPFYIGKTSVATMESGRYFGSLKSRKWAKKWHAAVAVTPEKFRKRILASFETENEALDHEDMLSWHFCVHKSELFANMHIGGKKFSGGCMRGKKLSEEHKAKLSEAKRGRKRSEETCQKMSEARKGLKHSEETRQKMSETKRGKKFSEDHKRKLSEAAKKRTKWKHSEETRKKMSETRTGKHHSEETRKRMSETQSARRKTQESTRDQ